MPKSVDAKKNARKGQGEELVETMRESTERQPGDISFRLRRRMSDPMADFFSERGQKIYEESVSSINDSLDSLFKKGIQGLSGVIKKQLGELGYDESLHHFRPWLEDIIHDIGQKGMAEAIANLDGMVSGLVVDYTEEEDAGPSDEDLLGFGVPEISEDEVEEVTDMDIPILEDADEGEEELEGVEGEPPEESDAEGEEEDAAAAASASAPRNFRPKSKAQKKYAKTKRRRALLAAATKSLAALKE